MKILQLLKTSDGAGWALDQMCKLVKEGYEVTVVLPFGGRHIESYNKCGIKTIDFDFSLKRLPFSIKKFRKIINDVKPDIIHSHFYVCTLYMRLLLRDNKTPRIFQLPGPSHLFYWITRELEIMLAQENDYWAGACEYSCQAYLSHGIEPRRVALAYYQFHKPIMDIEIFHNQNRLRRELGLSDNAILIGMISYMYPPKKYLGQKQGIKGHEDFIDAIALASKVNPNIYGLCIGGAWNGAYKYEKQVRKYASEKTDHIIFCGNRDNVPEIYPELFCAVQPSHEENLGGAGQAIVYETPIVSSNAGGLPDIVKDGKTGYLFPKKDANKLAEAILKMVNNPDKAKEMAVNAKKYYSHLMDINNGAIERFYESIIYN